MAPDSRISPPTPSHQQSTSGLSMSEMEQELASEYERFIEFGQLLDKQMRTYLVYYLQNKFDPNLHLIPELDERYYNYLKSALDEVFLIDGLIEVTSLSPRLKRQIVQDILYWLRKAYQKAEILNPFQDEQDRLSSWAITPIHIFAKRWPALPTYLAGMYDRSEIDHQFFNDRFHQYLSGQPFEELSATDGERIDLLLKDLLAQWDALLYAKIISFRMKKFGEETTSFVEFVNKKVTEYNKIRDFINPVSDYLGWDMSRQLWQDTSFDVLYHYAELLQDEKSIKQLADLLGNMREAEIEIEEETFEKTIIKQEWVTDEHSRSEIVGVKTSDELSHMISSEAGLLGDLETETLFLKKYADKKLLTLRYEDRKLISSEDHYAEVHQKIKQKEKGPFIICVDTSESMRGRPEQIAKVTILGVLKMAMNQNRRAYLINFSSGIQTLDLYDIANSIDDIAAFLRMSFHGGTDATLALYEALRQLERHEYRDADVLMVSDFIMSRLDDTLLKNLRYQQQNCNTQFHCLTLGTDANEHVLADFDTNWLYDPEQKGIIKSLTQGLHNIQERY